MKNKEKLIVTEFDKIDKRRLTEPEKAQILDALKTENPELHSLLRGHFVWEGIWHDRVHQLIGAFTEVIGEHKF